ncbi:hypothetical protein BP5796_04181 [Coleophoma crateriformis]|uniref:Uncharacterized protein n=1 Tax=Coleophoma crateriformis TaxID=565419 RepID=A0A3D8SHR8_9HELO|nr:hypothetical protein BP5796_04181 [Coleophoma crateriformis]
MKLHILAVLLAFLGAVLVLGEDISYGFIGITINSDTGTATSLVHRPAVSTSVTTTWTTLPTSSSTITVTATTYVIVHVTNAIPTASKSLAASISNPFSQLTKGFSALRNWGRSATESIESGVDFLAFVFEDAWEELLIDLAIARKDMYYSIVLGKQLLILIYKHFPNWIYRGLHSLRTFSIIAPWTDHRQWPKPMRSHFVRLLDMLTVFTVCLGATIWVRKVEVDALRRINGRDPLSRWIRPMIKPAALLLIGLNAAYCYILLQVIIAEGFGEPYSVSVRGVQRQN